MAQLSERLKVTADVRMGSDEGLITQPTQHFGAGVEFRPVSFLPLRAGIANGNTPAARQIDNVLEQYGDYAAGSGFFHQFAAGAKAQL